MRKKGFVLLTLYILFHLFVFQPRVTGQDTIPEDFCISEEEIRLINLINDYRLAMNLAPVPVSKSLCYVAKTHAVDLYTHKPDSNTCNFHSWSDKGSWRACCFEKQSKDKSCMINKPKEITSYSGYAYEIVYWENKQANADKAFNQWKETSASRSLITNFKEWQSYEWKAMGVSIYKGFAIVWFGEDVDQDNKVLVCGKNTFFQFIPPKSKEESRIVSSETGRFYVIVGSFNSEEDAKKQLNNYIQEGFKKAKVVSKDEKYRISLSDYPTLEQATKAKDELPSKYKGAWVLTY